MADEISEKPRMTLADVGIKVGKTRQALWEWQKRHSDFPSPDADGNYQLPDVLTWMEEHGKELAHGRGKDADDVDLKIIRHTKLYTARGVKALAETREFNLEVLKGKYLSRETFEDSQAALVAVFVQRVEKAGAYLSAKLAMREEEFIRAELEKWQAELRKELIREFRRGIEIADDEIRRIAAIEVEEKMERVEKGEDVEQEKRE